MLRTFRDRLRLRRSRRDTNPASVLTPATPPQSAYDTNQAQYHASLSAANHNNGLDKNNLASQPRVFRNRSADSTNSAVNGRRERQILALLSGKALRTFHRARTGHDKIRTSNRDRPLSTPAYSPNNNQSNHTQQHDEQNRNQHQDHLHNRSNAADDSFLSLPSTHASRDPFLNDDVPLDLGHDEQIEDRPRERSRWRTDLEEIDAFHQQTPATSRETSQTTAARQTSIYETNITRPGRESSGGASSPPPVSYASASTFRKRCSLWKRTYDPEDDSQPRHEREILHAVSLLETSVKDSNVRAAQQLTSIVEAQTAEVDTVIEDVKKEVENARAVATQLPSTRDPRFEHLLYDGPTSGGLGYDGGTNAKVDAERIFLELNWTERIWDVESLLAEKRYEECFASISKLQQDGIMNSGGAITTTKFQGLRTQLGSEMCVECAEGGQQVAATYAPFLKELDMDAEARKTVLLHSEKDLRAELRHLRESGDGSARMTSALLDRTLTVLTVTHAVHSQLSRDDANCASPFVAWIATQADRVYGEFISPMLAKARKADPVTILATIEAIRYRQITPHESTMKEEKSLAALLQTRIVTHLRKDLEVPLRDAERQLSERARTYASATPRNWRDGPYQSGKAVCDELNVLTRGLEGSLIGLGSEADILSGNLLVIPVLVYCTTLLERGMSATEEDRFLSVADMQEGVFATFQSIGKTMERLHQKLPTVPLLERVGHVLTSTNPGGVRMLYGEICLRRAPIKQRVIAQDKDMEENSITSFTHLNEKGYLFTNHAPDIHSGNGPDLVSSATVSSLSAQHDVEQQARRLLSHHRRLAVHG